MKSCLCRLSLMMYQTTCELDQEDPKEVCDPRISKSPDQVTSWHASTESALHKYPYTWMSDYINFSRSDIVGASLPFSDDASCQQRQLPQHARAKMDKNPPMLQLCALTLSQAAHEIMWVSQLFKLWIWSKNERQEFVLRQNRQLFNFLSVEVFIR